MNIPWIEKYRPHKSNDIILDPFIKTIMDKILETKNIPNLIITGEPGTGKTSTILCIAKEIYKNYDIDEYVIELNASDERGLTMINSTIYPFCKKKTELPKLIILDESDCITAKAQNLLCNIIDEFINSVSFVFICNDYIQIKDVIHSRCIILKYPKISINDLYNKIIYICNNENIKYTDSAIYTLIQYSEYDIRQCINNLECIYYSCSELTDDTIKYTIDTPTQYYIDNILHNCINKNIKEAIHNIIELNNKGYYPNDILLLLIKNIDKLNAKNNIKIILKKIVSHYYIRTNNGVDTLLQLYGCISNIINNIS